MKKTVFLGRELYCCHLNIARHNKFSALSVTLCPGLHTAAKIAIFRVLRKIASLTIFRTSRGFSKFFVMLISSLIHLFVQNVSALLAILSFPCQRNLSISTGKSQRSQSLNKGLLSKGSSDIREIPLYFKFHHFMPFLN